MTDLSTLTLPDLPDPWQQGLQAGWSVIDGATASRSRTLEADLIIIGTGAGGAVAAEQLSQRGLKVLLVESGRLKSSRHFNLDEGEAYRDLYQEGATRTSRDGHIAILQGRAVGGSTVVNWTSSFRTPSQTLAHWQSAWGLSELTEAAMAPWFSQMEQRLHVAPWPAPSNANNDLIRRAAERLGWHWDLIPRNVQGCWNLGYCGTGCPLNAKQSMLVTCLPSALEQGATLLHSAEARRLLRDGDRIRAVEVDALGPDQRPTGITFTLHAPQVVLAGGAINTPGLLLRSRVPDPFRRIGQRTFLHPVSFVAGFYDERMDSYYGAPQSVYSDQFTWRDGVTGKVGYKLEAMPVHPGITAVLLDGVGATHAADMAELPHLGVSLALLRDGFHEHSPGGTVLLRDDHSPVLDYRMTDYLWEGVRHSLTRQVEMHFAAGAREVRPRHGQARRLGSWAEARAALADWHYADGLVPLGSAHVMGGCAMGADERTSVTDEDGRYRWLDNLTILDASVFPTSVGVNPQLSIYALSARNASRLADRIIHVKGA